MNSETDKDKFRELLDAEYTWPARYIFKFVVVTGQIKQVESLFGRQAKISFKESSGGKYTSVTINAEMASSDEIIEIYEQATAIEGIISL